MVGEGFHNLDADFTDGVAIWCDVVPAWVGRQGTGPFPYFYDLGRWAIDHLPTFDTGVPAFPVMVTNDVLDNASGFEVSAGAFTDTLHFNNNLIWHANAVGHNLYWWLIPGLHAWAYALKYF